MKILILAACLIATVHSAAAFHNIFSSMLQQGRECFAELNIPPETIFKLKDNMLNFPDEAGCLYNCMNKKIGLTNPDGTYNLDVLQGGSEPADWPKRKNQLEGIVKQCEQEAGSDQCKRSICFMRKVIKPPK